jgi:hypothetical protein
MPLIVKQAELSLLVAAAASATVDPYEQQEPTYSLLPRRQNAAGCLSQRQFPLFTHA